MAQAGFVTKHMIFNVVHSKFKGPFAVITCIVVDLDRGVEKASGKILVIIY